MSTLNAVTWYNILYKIYICCLTVHHSENSDVSCAVMCDEEFRNIKPNSPSNVETNRRQVRVDRYGFLNCTTKQMFDGYSPVNSTHEPSVTSNKTTGGCFAVSPF